MKRFDGLLGFKVSHPQIYFLGIMIFFWAMYDAAISYLAPLTMSQSGFSNTMVGIILATSSVFGALFDFILCKIFKNVSFRRIFIIMLGLCLLLPLVLWQAKEIWMFLISMAIWGLYYDLYAFGTFDFIGRHVEKRAHASSWAIIFIFLCLGCFIGPIVIDLITDGQVTWISFAASWLFLILAILFLFVLLTVTKKLKTFGKKEEDTKKRSIYSELKIWKRLSTLISPVLILTLLFFMVEAFFWTLIPLFGEQFDIPGYGGLILGASTIPAILVGWMVGRITRSFGKKRTAMFSFLIGCLFLSFFCFITNPYLILGIVFISFCFLSLALPSINGAYADYISETPKYEGEIEGLEDFSNNLGFIIGPVLAGLLSDLTSIPVAFTLMGVFGMLVTIILIKITPKHITIK